MKQVKGIISTTHIDKQNHKMTLGALQDVMRQIQQEYVPTGLEHDIRVPPLGRIASAKIVKLEDGEYALEALTEMFESGDSPESLSGDGRRMKLSTKDIQTIGVEYDTGLSGDQGLELLHELSEIAGTDDQPKEMLKKSMDPVSTLTIAAGAFAVGAIGKGFFSRLGEDLYEKLKTSLAKYYHNAGTAERILDFRFSVMRDGKPVEVHVVITNPTEEMVDELLQNKFDRLDDLLTAVFKTGSDSVKVVIEYCEEGDLKLRYTVRGDCVPLPPAGAK